MLVVLDTNVIVSALHFPRSRLAKIPTLIQEGKVDLAISPFILGEVEGVLVDKMGWTRELTKEARETLRSLATVIVDPEESISVVKDDHADNRILECAVEAGADFLVTGDKEHLLPIEIFRGVKIVSPAGFLDICGE